MVLIQSDRPSELHGTHLGLGWVYVAVDDIEAHYERAKAAGVELLNEPHDALDGTQRGYIARDLEGNTEGSRAMPRGYPGHRHNRVVEDGAHATW